MTPEIEAIATRHVLSWTGDEDWCAGDHSWPCDTAKVLDALRAAEARIEALRPRNGWQPAGRHCPRNEPATG